MYSLHNAQPVAHCQERGNDATRRIIIVISYAVVEVFSPNLPPNGHCIYAICSRPIGFSQYGTFCCARLASIRINPHGRSKHIFSIQLTVDYIEPGRPASQPADQGRGIHISYRIDIVAQRPSTQSHTHTHNDGRGRSWRGEGDFDYTERKGYFVRIGLIFILNPRINHESHNFMSHTQSVVVVAHFLDDEVLRIIIILIIILL